MSKIYEALQHAHREKKSSSEAQQIHIENGFLPANLNLEDKMLSLYKVVDSKLPQLPKKIIQFIGSREGEGTSTIAREFARVAATKIDKSVLLLDADRYRPIGTRNHSEQTEYSWIEALRLNKSMDNAVYRVGSSNLFISPSCNSSVSTPEIFDSNKIVNLWAKLKQKFDIILVDSPPLAQSPDGLAIASKVDGVLLVLEAEKTRWQAAKEAKEQISNIGGKVIGIVFNKRRYYIPNMLYKLLYQGTIWT
jgi:protein-tyrosine kinase